MRRVLVTLCSLFVTCSIAVAQDATDEVRVLLDERNYEALDERIARLHEASIVGKDGSELRELYETLFNTTHPQRLTIVDTWLQEKPSSPYALAAKVWGSIKLVEMHGTHGFETPGAPSDRLKLYLDARDTALDLVEKTLARSPDFVPSIDAWISSRAFYMQRPRSTERNHYVYATLMHVSPNRDSVLRIIAAINASFAVPFQEIMGACLKYAASAKDYDTDVCTIEAALRHHVDTDLEQHALTALETRDEPYLDDLKLEKILFERDFFDRDQTEAFVDTLKRLHQQTLKNTSQVKRFLLHGRRIASFTHDPSYVVWTQKKALALLDLKLRDDPLNRILLEQKTRLHLRSYRATAFEEDLAKARAIWPDAMVYGRYRSDMWRLGVELATADRPHFDILDQVAPMENAISYARPGFGATVQALSWMTTARHDAVSRRKELDGRSAADLVRIIEGLNCPILRAARVADGLCRSKSVPWETCAPDTALYAQVQSVLAEGAEGSCLDVSMTLLSDLEYQPIPSEELTSPWVEN